MEAAQALFSAFQAGRVEELPANLKKCVTSASVPPEKCFRLCRHILKRSVFLLRASAAMEKQHVGKLFETIKLAYDYAISPPAAAASVATTESSLGPILYHLMRQLWNMGHTTEGTLCADLLASFLCSSEAESGEALNIAKNSAVFFAQAGVSNGSPAESTQKSNSGNSSDDKMTLTSNSVPVKLTCRCLSVLFVVCMPEIDTELVRRRVRNVASLLLEARRSRTIVEYLKDAVHRFCEIAGHCSSRVTGILDLLLVTLIETLTENRFVQLALLAVCLSLAAGATTTEMAQCWIDAKKQARRLKQDTESFVTCCEQCQASLSPSVLMQILVHEVLTYRCSSSYNIELSTAIECGLSLVPPVVFADKMFFILARLALEFKEVAPEYRKIISQCSSTRLQLEQCDSPWANDLTAQALLLEFQCRHIIAESSFSKIEAASSSDVKKQGQSGTAGGEDGSDSEKKEGKDSTKDLYLRWPDEQALLSPLNKAFELWTNISPMSAAVEKELLFDSSGSPRETVESIPVYNAMRTGRCLLDVASIYALLGHRDKELEALETASSIVTHNHSNTSTNVPTYDRSTNDHVEPDCTRVVERYPSLVPYSELTAHIALKRVQVMQEFGLTSVGIWCDLNPPVDRYNRESGETTVGSSVGEDFECGENCLPPTMESIMCSCQTLIVQLEEALNHGSVTTVSSLGQSLHSAVSSLRSMHQRTYTSGIIEGRALLLLSRVGAGAGIKLASTPLQYITECVKVYTGVYNCVASSPSGVDGFQAFSPVSARNYLVMELLHSMCVASELFMNAGISRAALPYIREGVKLSQKAKISLRVAEFFLWETRYLISVDQPDKAEAFLANLPALLTDVPPSSPPPPPSTDSSPVLGFDSPVAPLPVVTSIISQLFPHKDGCTCEELCSVPQYLNLALQAVTLDALLESGHSAVCRLSEGLSRCQSLVDKMPRLSFFFLCSYLELSKTLVLAHLSTDNFHRAYQTSCEALKTASLTTESHWYSLKTAEIQFYGLAGYVFSSNNQNEKGPIPEPSKVSKSKVSRTSRAAPKSTKQPTSRSILSEQESSNKLSMCCEEVRELSPPATVERLRRSSFHPEETMSAGHVDITTPLQGGRISIVDRRKRRGKNAMSSEEGGKTSEAKHTVRKRPHRYSVLIEEEAEDMSEESSAESEIKLAARLDLSPDDDVPEHEEILVALNRAHETSVVFPSVPFYSHLCQGLAHLACSPSQAAFYRCEGTYIAFRHSAQLNLHVKIRAQEKVVLGKRAVDGGGDEKEDETMLEYYRTCHSLLHFTSDVGQLERWVEELPENWRVCQLVPAATPGSKHSKEKLHMVRLGKGREPFVTTLPGYEASSAADLLEFVNIIRESSESSKITAKVKWWAARDQLNSRLGGLLEKMEVSWLGGLNGALRGGLDDDVLGSAKKKIGAILRTKAALVSPSLIEVLVLSALTSGSDRISAALRANAAGALTDAAVSRVTKAVMECAAGLDPTSLSSHQVILVLGEKVQTLPWESLSFLHSGSTSNDSDGKDDPTMHPSICRMPSLPFLLAHLRAQSPPASSSYQRGVNRCKGFYLLNPDGSLQNTQNTFETMFIDEEWDGVVGRAPTKKEMVGALTRPDLDIYAYCGHGSGSKYLRGAEIEALRVGATGLLMGCSSGVLDEANKRNNSHYVNKSVGGNSCMERGAVRDGGLGLGEPRSGTPLTYLLSGCPCILANLWDITDKDIDRFFSGLLKAWLDDKSEDRLPLPSYVWAGRRACKFKYLVGAAPVVYGLPVSLRMSS